MLTWGFGVVVYPWWLDVGHPTESAAGVPVLSSSAVEDQSWPVQGRAGRGKRTCGQCSDLRPPSILMLA